MIRVMSNVRLVLVALVLGVLGLAAPASAQIPEVRQIELTEPQIQGFIAAQKDLAALGEKIDAASDQVDAKLQAELEAIARKHGFKSFEEFDDVAANITLVLSGIDPESGNFTDPQDSIRAEIEEIRADKSIPDKDKEEMLKEMDESLKATPKIAYQKNIELVKKHVKAIEAALQ